jgi:hypothetical protein
MLDHHWAALDQEPEPDPRLQPILSSTTAAYNPALIKSTGWWWLRKGWDSSSGGGPHVLHTSGRRGTYENLRKAAYRPAPVKSTDWWWRTGTVLVLGRPRKAKKRFCWYVDRAVVYSVYTDLDSSFSKARRPDLIGWRINENSPDELRTTDDNIFWRTKRPNRGNASPFIIRYRLIHGLNARLLLLVDIIPLLKLYLWGVA